MLQEVVAAFRRVSGVTAGAIFGADGAPLAQSLAPPYDVLLLEEVLRRYRALAEYHDAMTGDGTLGRQAAFFFDGGRVCIRSTSHHHLVAVATGDANISAVTVAFNVAVLKLNATTQNGGFVAPENGMNDPRTHVGGPLSQSSAARGRASDTSDSMRLNGSRTMSWTMGASSTATGGVGRKVMRHVLMVSLRHFGDEGRSLLEKTLRDLGTTPSRISAQGFAELILRMARALPPERRAAFKAEILGDG